MWRLGGASVEPSWHGIRAPPSCTGTGRLVRGASADPPAAVAPLAPGAIPERRLGRTGVMLPMLGLGGWHLGDAGSEGAARDLVETALAEGIRFFDTAESYQAGTSERWLG